MLPPLGICEQQKLFSGAVSFPPATTTHLHVSFRALKFEAHGHGVSGPHQAFQFQAYVLSGLPVFIFQLTNASPLFQASYFPTEWEAFVSLSFLASRVPEINTSCGFG